MPVVTYLSLHDALPIWLKRPVPLDMVRLLPPETVTAPFAVTAPLEVSPALAVINPETVGVAVQTVPLTVRFPPKVVRVRTRRRLNSCRVVASCAVKCLG